MGSGRCRWTASVCSAPSGPPARWLWPGRFRPALLAGCGALGLGAVCFAFGPTGGGVDLLLTCGADALLAGALGFALRRFPPETPGAGMLLVGAAAAAALGGVTLGPVCLGVVFCAALEAALCCRGQGKAALACCAVLGAALCGADASLGPVSPAPVQRLLCWPPDAGWKPLPPMRAAV